MSGVAALEGVVRRGLRVRVEAMRPDHDDSARRLDRNKAHESRVAEVMARFTGWFVMLIGQTPTSRKCSRLPPRLDATPPVRRTGSSGQQIGRACVGKECRSRWSPYH